MYVAVYPEKGLEIRSVWLPLRVKCFNIPRMAFSVGLYFEKQTGTWAVLDINLNVQRRAWGTVKSCSGSRL